MVTEVRKRRRDGVNAGGLTKLSEGYLCASVKNPASENLHLRVPSGRVRSGDVGRV